MSNKLRWNQPHVDPTTRRRWRPDDLTTNAFPAKWGTICAACHREIKVGEWMQCDLDHRPPVKGKKAFRHATCHGTNDTDRTATGGTAPLRASSGTRAHVNRFRRP